MDKTEVSFFVSLIEKELGIDYPTQNIYQLEGRLESFLRSSGVKTLTELKSKFELNELSSFQREQFFDLATNNETSFFRDKNLFDCLHRTLFPNLISQKTDKKLKVWSMASSTGQEAVSVGIILQQLSNHEPQLEYSIYLSDVSHTVLDRARKGTYSELEMSRGLDNIDRHKYFSLQTDGTWKVRDEIHKRFKYTQMNLQESWPIYEQFDLILLRNVLIYFDVTKRKRIVEKLTSHLNTNAFLAFGATENLIGISDEFESILIDGAYFYKRKA